MTTYNYSVMDLLANSIILVIIGGYLSISGDYLMKDKPIMAMVLNTNQYHLM